MSGISNKNIYNERKSLFYNRLKFLIEQSNMTYQDIGNRLPYYKGRQAFSQAFNNQTMKFEALIALCDILGYNLKTEIVKKSGEEILEDSLFQFSSEGRLHELKNQIKEKDQVIADLRSNLQDKQTLIELLEQRSQVQK
ncbi:MAG: hypothetical protein EP332_06480 [Bacteroidetes bacterium]|nr:MAG: hypothetical protein EP332_06480 [Bacteroidota bacterium]